MQSQSPVASDKKVEDSLAKRYPYLAGLDLGAEHDLIQAKKSKLTASQRRVVTEIVGFARKVKGAA